MMPRVREKDTKEHTELLNQGTIQFPNTANAVMLDKANLLVVKIVFLRELSFDPSY